MNADELGSVQAPLKNRYRAEPGAARVTLKASGAGSAQKRPPRGRPQA
jgi:hypothetical protein